MTRLSFYIARAVGLVKRWLGGCTPNWVLVLVVALFVAFVLWPKPDPVPSEPEIIIKRVPYPVEKLVEGPTPVPQRIVIYDTVETVKKEILVPTGLRNFGIISLGSLGLPQIEVASNRVTIPYADTAGVFREVTYWTNTKKRNQTRIAIGSASWGRTYGTAGVELDQGPWTIGLAAGYNKRLAGVGTISLDGKFLRIGANGLYDGDLHGNFYGRVLF